MKKQIILLCTVALLIGNLAMAQGNWVAAEPSLSPASAMLSSSGTVSASGTFTWSSAVDYNNEKHLATLTFALPTSIYPSTGVPSLVYASNNTPVAGVTFAIVGNSWSCEFAPNTTLVAGTKVTFKIDNMEIKDDKNYSDQQCSHFVSFLSSPANETLGDNAATSIFQTVVSGPLPVGLLNFDAKLLDQGLSANVDLRWTTTVEVNASHFIIERSKDAIEWAEVSNVRAKGNTNTNTDYQTTDNEPYTGISYYRLKQFDIDNSFSYSDVRVINNGIATSFNVFPNPTTDKLNVQFSLEKDAKIEIKLMSVEGRVVKSILLYGKEGDQITDMNIGELPSGVYELNFYKNAERINTTKIQKN